MSCIHRGNVDFIPHLPRECKRKDLFEFVPFYGEDAPENIPARIPPHFYTMNASLAIVGSATADLRVSPEMHGRICGKFFHRIPERLRTGEVCQRALDLTRSIKILVLRGVLTHEVVFDLAKAHLVKRGSGNLLTIFAPCAQL